MVEGRKHRVQSINRINFIRFSLSCVVLFYTGCNTRDLSLTFKIPSLKSKLLGCVRAV